MEVLLVLCLRDHLAALAIPELSVHFASRVREAQRMFCGMAVRGMDGERAEALQHLSHMMRRFALGVPWIAWNDDPR
eukprot:817933-Pyramimonas_sp.AAC.1